MQGYILAGASAARLCGHHPRRHAGPAAATGYRVSLTLTRAARTGEGGPAVEVPLDGTVYDLDTGRVLEWCPRNNPVRVLLGSLKVRRGAPPCSMHAACTSSCVHHTSALPKNTALALRNEAICEQAGRCFASGILDAPGLPGALAGDLRVQDRAVRAKRRDTRLADEGVWPES
jgi:hypothetical protein